MLKKIIFGVMVVALLAGSEDLLARERSVETGAKQKQVRRPRGQAGQKQQGLRPGGKQPGQQEFDRYFNALTKAYRENDRAKMGQMLRKINQFRQKRQRAKVVPGRRVRDLPERGGAGKGRPGRFRRDFSKNRPGFWHGAMGGRGRGLRGGGWGRGGRGFRHRGIGGGRGRGFRGRGMGGGRGRNMRGGGMGRRGQGFRGRGGRAGQGIPRRNMNVPRRGNMPREDFDWDW